MSVSADVRTRGVEGGRKGERERERERKRGRGGEREGGNEGLRLIGFSMWASCDTRTPSAGPAPPRHAD